MTIKQDILIRLYVAFSCMLLLAISILGKAFYIQSVKGEQLLEQAAKNSRPKVFDAERGNIYSSDGRLLATSIPNFDIYFDPNAQGISSEDFELHVDALSEKISAFAQKRYADPALHYSKAGMKRKLQNARKNNKRYISIFKNIDFHEVKAIKQWPLFERGQNKGGLIITKENKRTWPWGELARRTLGSDRGNGIQAVGLEASFNKELAGLKGLCIERRVGESWLPLDKKDNIKPINGADVVTTIDVDFQQITQQALLEGLVNHKADHGCAVVMEVATGKIKSIANLGLNKNNKYIEAYNYAVGESREPGSTFKVATMAALLESNKVTIQDKVAVENGKHQFCREQMKDASSKYRGTISLEEVFSVSSNVGFAKTVVKHFGNKPANFIGYLKDFLLDEKTDIHIIGETQPVILDTDNKAWNDCVTLPWLSVGYSLSLTPLQRLTFFNAIANNGKRVKPYLVEKVSKVGESNESYLYKRYHNNILNTQNTRICSEKTAKQLQELMVKVVENGTAKNIQTDLLNYGGKTGTSKISKGREGYENEYQSSFIGFFPKENPQYSCAVVIAKPQGDEYYGNVVAAPVFKRIAEQINAIDQPLHPLLTKNTDKILTEAQLKDDHLKSGAVEDYIMLSEYFENPVTDYSKNEWTKPKTNEGKLLLNTYELKEKITPNVKGMGLKDAIYLLENHGLRVIFTGRGKVQKQSIQPGVQFKKSEIIRIELS